MKFTLLLSSVLRFAGLLVAAATLNPGLVSTAVAAPIKPTIYAFNVFGNTTINQGETATLNWSVGDATTVSISPNVGVVTGTQVDVTPLATTTYTLTATNAAGSVSKTKKITVIVPPTMQSLSATPDSIPAGASTKLNWSATGANYFLVVADNGDDLGNLTAKSMTVRPEATTTYTVTAVNTAGTAAMTVTVPVTAPPPKPVISSFTAAPTKVSAGAPTTLSWAVTNATSLSISPGVGAVTGTSITVNPTASTAYTLTAKNSTGTVTKKVTVTVSAAVPPPVINSFTASPVSITAGSPTTLAWSVSGAASLTITADVGSSPGVVTGTSISVSPTANTTYALTATNATGSVVKTATVTVTAAVPPPVINSFTASPSSVTNGSPTTLAWSVSGAASLTITADVGSSPGVVTGTSISVSPSANTTYTLTAKNAGGSVTKTAAVTVTNPVLPPVITSFTAAPASIAVGGASTLNWTVTGATSLSIASNVGASPGAVTGTSVAVTPTASTTYTLTATNAGGSVTKRSTVAVNSPLPVIPSFGAIPSTLNAGESATLFWNVSGAVSVSIAVNHGPSPGVVTGNSMIIAPTETVLYTLTATNATGGTATSVAQVTVNAAPPLPVPVITSFDASPDTISLGAATTLNWSITGGDNISIAANHGASPGLVTGTSVAVSPTVDTIYTITATNNFGTATATTDVTVTGPTAPVIGSFGASPAFIQAGTSSTLTWSVSGADSISIAADVGPSPGTVTGTSMVVNPTQTTTYTLTATNAIGSTTAIVPVTIFTAGGDGGVVHPRIWVTPASALTLNARAAANDPAWIKLRNDCDAYVNMAIRFPDQDGGNNTIDGGYQYNDYLKPAEELALGYVAAKTADPVRAARYAAKEKQLLLALADPVHHGRTTTDSGYSIRSYVPALALGYDWIFETLSPAERVQIYTEINRWVVSYEATGFGRDFPQGNYFAGYYCAKALAALATEGENPSAPAMWNDWLNRIHFSMAQPYHQQWLSGGGSAEGWNYGPFETLNMIRPVAAALTAKGLDLVHDSAKPMSYFDGHARWMTQFTWPDMKTVSDRGFVYNSDNPTGTDASWATQYNGFLHLVNGSNAAIMQRYTLDLRAQQGTGDIEAWAEFLLHNNSAPAASYRTDLSYKTNGDGQVAMRSSWATDAVWGAFQAGPYTGYPGSSEEFFDEGALTIQRGGVQFLVNAWGAMMRNTPGTTDGDPVFNDVFNELFSDQTDGVHAGRRIFNTYYAVRPDGYWGQGETTPFDHSTTTLSRFEEGGSYVLMRGTHLENQYFEDHPISAWTRTVAYVRPQLFVAYDRTSINNPATDHWMAWHVAAAPVEQSGAVPGTHRFDVVDTRPAFGGNLFRGRVTTVLPVGHAVTTVDTFGRGKVYRLEVRPGTPTATATWLTVFDASASTAAAGSAAPLTAAAGNVLAGAVEGTVIATANGSNVVVLFSQTGQPVSGAVAIVVPAAATYCLATDLAPNAGYAVTAGAANGSLSVSLTPGGPFVTTAEGTLVVNLSATGMVTAP